MEVFDAYTAIVEAVQENEPIPNQAVTWMAEAIFLNAHTGVSVDEALGLKKTGDHSRTVRNQYLRSERDKALYRAWLLLDEDKPRRKTEKLLKKMQQFQHSRVLRFGYPEQTELDKALLEAFSTGIKMPFSDEGLHSIIQRQSDDFSK